MFKSTGDLYAYLLGRPWLARFHRRLFYLSGRALGMYNFRTPTLSGENWITRKIVGAAQRPVVFDVGANEGEWLAAVLHFNAGAEIHAFEPQAGLASAIRTRHPNVRVNQVAVGELPGNLDLYDYADHPGSQHASLLAGVIDAHGGQARKTSVPVVTIDDYCLQHSIPHIDFLKVDVECFELQVLKGARRMLEEGRVAAIQFEITHLNVVSRVFFDDFVKLLGERYALHRLLPHGLTRLSPGNHWFNEQFAYQNIVAFKNA